MRVNVCPWWLRFWHWCNALLFLVLIASGVSLHFAAPNGHLIPFQSALILHNFAGLLLSLFYGFFLVANLFSGNWRFYVPRLRGLFGGLLRQGHFYLIGIFRGEPHPFPHTMHRKFNPLQQLTYLAVVTLGMPLLIGSGNLILFPKWTPGLILSLGGTLFLAVLHYVVGFLLTLFMLGHIYLATTGETPRSELRKMISGWADVSESEHEHP